MIGELQISDEDRMNEALSAIHDEAAKLLVDVENTARVAKGLQTIISIARYRTDVRTPEEKA